MCPRDPKPLSEGRQVLINLDYEKLAKLICEDLRQHPVSWEWLSPGQLASYIAVPERTLEEWRRYGKGPKFVKLGKHIRYRLRDVDRWAEEQTHEA